VPSDDHGEAMLVAGQAQGTASPETECPGSSAARGEDEVGARAPPAKPSRCPDATRSGFAFQVMYERPSETVGDDDVGRRDWRALRARAADSQTPMARFHGRADAPYCAGPRCYSRSCRRAEHDDAGGDDALAARVKQASVRRFVNRRPTDMLTTLRW